MIAIPALIPFLSGLSLVKFGGISKRSHFRALLSDLSLGASQIGLTVTFLAYQAWLMTDAIVRTLDATIHAQKPAAVGDRIAIQACRRSEYLQDVPADDCERRAGVAALLIVYFGHRAALPLALPFVALWVGAPAVARWISLPPPASDASAALAQSGASAAFDRPAHVAIFRNVRYGRGPLAAAR